MNARIHLITVIYLLVVLTPSEASNVRVLMDFLEMELLARMNATQVLPNSFHLQ